MKNMKFINLWWNVIGRGQIIMIAIMLCIFFVSLYFTNSIETSVFILPIVNVLILAVLTYSRKIVIFSIAAAPAVVAVAVVIIMPGSNATVLVVNGIVGILAIIVTIVAIGRNVSGLSRTATVFSVAGEFIIILLPMLGTVLHWWW